MLAVRIVSRRWLLRVFQWPGLLLMPAVFASFLTVQNKTFFNVNLEFMHLGELPITTMSLGMLLCGILTVGQFSFWGNYLPRHYPLHLRGTGESFAANIGGRMIGTSFAFVVTQLAGSTLVSGDSPPAKMACAAAMVALGVYGAGSILSFFLPEPSSDQLSND